MAVTNKYIAIKNFINGVPKDSDFELKTESLSLSLEPVPSFLVIVKTLYLSIDPSQLNRMKEYSSSQKAISFATRINPGEVIDSIGVGRVVASNQTEFVKGDLVFGVLQWAEYSIVKGSILFNKLEPMVMGFPLSYNLGVLGFSGLTAYGGFFEVCKPKKGERVFVSTAAGSVGNLVGQYAKLSGCFVVGCTGTDQKVELLKEKLGFDDAFNYKKEPDLKLALKRYFPDGIDIYFDNVGGEMLEAVVENMNVQGRIAACGAISEYANTRNKKVSLSLIDIIYKRIIIQGFLTPDLMNMSEDFISATSAHICAGKIHVLEDVSFGLESVPTAFIGIFRGDNIGKKIVKISD
ncbi:2-alkenal reductase (NADP(+)-dependent)-like isoform X1 [Impatiens glandulifera]|uniref:2-alkenal reductase (NADP(+)-dependent)-like isoform X1 n=1 Tax=Impatiens glandulifera TaxID=253017 RepID=UPI001FB0EAB9|nr:2-alkenal reductase (NADP(+)-dependent)-like isoform X1 [Impatiens glandulifera]